MSAPSRLNNTSFSGDYSALSLHGRQCTLQVQSNNINRQNLVKTASVRVTLCSQNSTICNRFTSNAASSNYSAFSICSPGNKCWFLGSQSILSEHLKLRGKNDLCKQSISSNFGF
ncbi:hypothetical protein OCU04_000043 [Sclerotinia nivalis]|uniref:Uncharacterized protein n=1 Tax=Sclerotinia nivalis TaxID=352851 RepID=A0A9X0AVB1_9HELO|nr:hypothetical protein OCU04_000043 [Sclerotinia nivalis]